MKHTDVTRANIKANPFTRPNIEVSYRRPWADWETYAGICLASRREVDLETSYHRR
jgi:hypothetical protein